MIWLLGLGKNLQGCRCLWSDTVWLMTVCYWQALYTSSLPYPILLGIAFIASAPTPKTWWFWVLRLVQEYFLRSTLTQQVGEKLRSTMLLGATYMGSGIPVPPQRMRITPPVIADNTPTHRDRNIWFSQRIIYCCGPWLLKPAIGIFWLCRSPRQRMLQRWPRFHWLLPHPCLSIIVLAGCDEDTRCWEFFTTCSIVLKLLIASFFCGTSPTIDDIVVLSWIRVSILRSVGVQKNVSVSNIRSKVSPTTLHAPVSDPLSPGAIPISCS